MAIDLLAMCGTFLKLSYNILLAAPLSRPQLNNQSTKPPFKTRNYQNVKPCPRVDLILHLLEVAIAVLVIVMIQGARVKVKVNQVIVNKCRHDMMIIWPSNSRYSLLEVQSLVQSLVES